MLALVLVAVAWAVPLAAYAFPAHSEVRHVLAFTVFYWTLPLLAVALAAWVNYSISTRVERDALRVLTIRGRGSFDLRRMTHMSSFSMWGYGSTRALRLFGADGRRVMVVLGGPLTSFNRTNLQRSRDLHAALTPYADRADARGQWWLGAGPRPDRGSSALHIVRVSALYAVGVVVALVVFVAYLATAQPTMH